VQPLRILLASLVACALALAPARARAGSDDPNTPKELLHVGVNEHLDGQLPLDAQFRDESGTPVRLGAYFTGKKPAVFLLAYHSCPVLCSMVQNAMAAALKDVAWTVGDQFDVVVVSIDPRDTPETARNKRAAIVSEYGRPGSEAGFHYLVGRKDEIDRVAQAAGFEYEYDERQGQYAHPTVVMLAKPNGQLARYLYGLEYSPTDVRVGLLEAANGRSISTIEQIILYCYHYDPQGGKYVLLATRVMRLGGALTAVVLGAFLAMMWTRERRRAAVHAASLAAQERAHLAEHAERDELAEHADLSDPTGGASRDEALPEARSVAAHAGHEGVRAASTDLPHAPPAGGSAAAKTEST